MLQLSSLYCTHGSEFISICDCKSYVQPMTGYKGKKREMLLFFKNPKENKKKIDDMMKIMKIENLVSFITCTVRAAGCVCSF